MVERLGTLGGLATMLILSLLWIQATFVSASDFQQSKRQTYEDKIYTLVIKQE